MQPRFLLTGFLLYLVTSCTTIPDTTVVQGTISYGQNSSIYIEKQPVHYKYADKLRYQINVDSADHFQREIPVDSAQIAQFVINDKSYPIYLQPGRTLSIQTGRGSFPDKVIVNGYPNKWNQKLRRYLQASDSLLALASGLEPSFDRGESDSLLYFYKRRIELAQQHLRNSPFYPLVYKASGKYLVKRLTYLRNRVYHQHVDPAASDSVRKQIIREAQQLKFFSYRSLHAQRAGIYDFANAYAMSHGIEKTLEQQYSQDLMKYDLKRLAYPTIDSIKVSLLKYIDNRRAKAYAQMHLVAERIGEMSIETAESSYNKFLEKYSDFPPYTAFLQHFYKQRKQVSPGQPAIPFSLPSRTGQIVKLSEFEGKYVLLDFWASWCIPCLNEFPHMKKLYKRYPRSKLEIISISIEKDSLRWRRALQRFNLPWLQLYGGNGFQQETFSKYQAGGIPFYILVDPQGNIERYNDIRPSFNLSKVLDSLLTADYQTTL